MIVELNDKNEYRWPVPDGYAYKFIVGTPMGLYNAFENDIVSVHDKILTRRKYSEDEWVELTWEKEIIAEKVRLAKEKKAELAIEAARIAEQQRVEAHNKFVLEAAREYASKPPSIPSLRPVPFSKLISNFFLRCWNYLKTGHPTLDKNTKIIW